MMDPSQSHEAPERSFDWQWNDVTDAGSDVVTYKTQKMCGGKCMHFGCLFIWNSWERAPDSAETIYI